jgi:hypothetical protein
MSAGERGDGVVDLYVGGRDLILHTDGAVVNGFILTSEAGLLGGEPYASRLGIFVTDTDRLLADQFGYALDGLHDLGHVLEMEKPLEDLQGDLTLTYTILGQAGVRSGTILSAVPGDINLDGVVDAADYITLKQNFGMTSGARWLQGNFNGDNNVNWTDLQTLMANFGTRSVGGAPAAPEPATLSLLALLALSLPKRGGLAMIRRRRK